MFSKILVPLDGSQLAEKALTYAEELAAKFESELILIWVLHPLVVMSDYAAHTYDDLINQEPEEARTYLTQLSEKLSKQGLRIQTAIVDGKPAADKIIDIAAEDNVDLIVMSTHGRSGIDRWVFGSVTNKVLQHAPCPVYVVRAWDSECTN